MLLRSRAFELYHVAKYMKPGRSNPGPGYVTLSIDFEMVGDQRERQRELLGLDALLDFSRERDFPMTFGVVGKIIEKDPSFIDKILEANTRNDIGSHSYSHMFFWEISREQADLELSKSVEIFKTHGLRSASLIFPRNQVRHLDLARKHGFRSFRSFHGEKHQLSVPESSQGVWDMPQSMFVYSGRSPGPLVSIARIARRRGLHYHLWCHPFNWGSDPARELERVMGPLASYCSGSGLEVRTMQEMVRACESDDT